MKRIDNSFSKDEFIKSITGKSSYIIDYSKITLINGEIFIK